MRIPPLKSGRACGRELDAGPDPPGEGPGSRPPAPASQAACSQFVRRSGRQVAATPDAAGRRPAARRPGRPVDVPQNPWPCRLVRRSMTARVEPRPRMARLPMTAPEQVALPATAKTDRRNLAPPAQAPPGPAAAGAPGAHPARPSAVPRAGHQPHRHGPLCAAAQVPSARPTSTSPAGRTCADELRRFDPSVLSACSTAPTSRPANGSSPPSTSPPPPPLCPYIAAAVELHDPQHPASQYARDYKKAVAARLADTAREAGAADPEQLGEQLALLIDGAAARTRVLNADAPPPCRRPHRQRHPRHSQRRPATGGSVQLTWHSAAGLDALPVARPHPLVRDTRQ